MIRSRWRDADGLGVTIRPPFGERAKHCTACSLWVAARTATGGNSSPRDGATAWTAPNCPIPEAIAGSRRTAARVTLGAIYFSSSSHFPLWPYSNIVKPVALPPARARLATKPAPTGSMTTTNTIGTVRVACSNGATVVVPVAATRTSGASATNSAACLRSSSALVVAQRMSIRTLWPLRHFIPAYHGFGFRLGYGSMSALSPFYLQLRTLAATLARQLCADFVAEVFEGRGIAPWRR